MKRVPWLAFNRSEEHTSELQSLRHLVCRLLLEKNNCPPLIYASTTRSSSLPSRSCARPGAWPGGWGKTRGLSCARHIVVGVGCFFFNDTATTEIYTLSLHDAFPISARRIDDSVRRTSVSRIWMSASRNRSEEHTSELQSLRHLVCRLLLEKKNT